MVIVEFLYVVIDMTVKYDKWFHMAIDKRFLTLRLQKKPE